MTIQTCTKVKLGKNECCFKTTVETIEANQDINLVNFPALAKAGDTHVVQFNDSLVFYEFTTEWGLKINHLNSTENIPNTHIVGTTAYDALNPLTGWTAPTNPILGNTVEVKFTDGTIANYTFDGTDWVLDFAVEQAIAPIHTNEIQSISYTGTQLPATAGVNIGDTNTTKFNDCTVVDYTWDGSAWVKNFDTKKCVQYIELSPVALCGVINYDLNARLWTGHLGGQWVRVNNGLVISSGFATVSGTYRYTFLANDCCTYIYNLVITRANADLTIRVIPEVITTVGVTTIPIYLKISELLGNTGCDFHEITFNKDTRVTVNYDNTLRYVGDKFLSNSDYTYISTDPSWNILRSTSSTFPGSKDAEVYFEIIYDNEGTTGSTSFTFFVKFVNIPTLEPIPSNNTASILVNYS